MILDVAIVKILIKRRINEAICLRGLRSIRLYLFITMYHHTSKKLLLKCQERRWVPESLIAISVRTRGC